MRKICSRCGIERDYSEFMKCSASKSGIGAWCVACKHEHARIKHIENKEENNRKAREWKANNPEKVKEYMVMWRSEHDQELKEYSKAYAESHREEIKAYEERTKERHAAKARVYRVSHKEQAKITTAAWLLANPGKKRDALRRWTAANPEKVRESLRRSNKKRASVPKNRVSDSISREIRTSLTESKAGRHWETLVDFTIDQLKMHLEKLFTSEMNWSNYGSVWEIDHKIPISVHNFERPEDLDFRICWSLKNLQPLERLKNRSKGNKLDKPFQPALAIAV